MSWRGTMRSIAAAGRAAERDAKRRQRELVGRQKEMAKLQEMERAILEVELYENRIEVFQTVHQDCSPELSWQQLLSIHEPAKPGRDETQERSAKAIATAHKPSVLDKMLRRTERKKDELNRRIELARKQDDEKFAEAFRMRLIRGSTAKASRSMAMTRSIFSFSDNCGISGSNMATDR